MKPVFIVAFFLVLFMPMAFAITDYFDVYSETGFYNYTTGDENGFAFQIGSDNLSLNTVILTEGCDATVVYVYNQTDSCTLIASSSIIDGNASFTGVTLYANTVYYISANKPDNNYMSTLAMPKDPLTAFNSDAHVTTIAGINSHCAPSSNNGGNIKALYFAPTEINVSGYVKYSNGVSVGSTAVVFVSNSSTILFFVFTDSSGFYSFLINPENITMTALVSVSELPSFSFSGSVNIFSSVNIEQNITVYPVHPFISGFVFYSNGTKVNNGTVDTRFQNGTFFNSTEIASDGSFLITSPGGNFTMAAESFSSGRDFAIAIAMHNIIDHTQQNLTVHPLVPIVSGFIFYPNGSIASGVSVDVRFYNGTLFNSTISALDGSYSLTSPIGNMNMTAEIYGLINYSSAISIPGVFDDFQQNLTMHQINQPIVSGYVFYGNGTGVGGALVEVFAGSTLLNSTNASSSGSYNLSWLYSQNVIFYAFNPANASTYVTRAVSAVESVSGLEINLTVPYWISQIFLTNCSVGSLGGAFTLNVSVWDESSGNPVYNASLISVNTFYSSLPPIYKNQSFNLSSGTLSNNVSLCIVPDTAVVVDQAYLVFTASGYSSRQYAFTAPLSNATQSLDLYLLNSNASSQVNFEVVDQNNLPVSGVEVRVEEWIPATGGYLTISSFFSDYLGRGMVFLNVPNIQYRFVLLQNNSIVRTVGPSFIYCPSGGTCPPQPYSVILQLSPSLPPIYYNEQGNFNILCVFTNSTGNLVCDATNIYGLSNTFNLVVFRRELLNFTTQCNVSQVSSSAVLVCNLGNYSGNYFQYTVSVLKGGSWLYLGSGSLDFSSSSIVPDWGEDSLFLTMLVVIVLFFGFIVFGPEIGILITGAGMVIGFIIGLMPVTFGSMAALVVIVLFSVFVLGRRG